MLREAGAAVPLKMRSGGYGSRRSPGRQGRRVYALASIHSAAPRHSVSRCSGRKKPKWPILAAPTSAGATVRISGLADVNPEQSSSTAGLVAQGSSEKHSAHIAPSNREKFGNALNAGSSDR